MIMVTEERKVCLNFIRYKETGGYPKMNIMVNEKEKEYLEEKYWDKIPLMRLRITKERRGYAGTTDMGIFIEKLYDCNDHWSRYKQKSWVDD